MTKMFLDTVHYSARSHYGVVLDEEGYILGRTEMFRTKAHALEAAQDLRDALTTKTTVAN